jgi:hypothetical protein
MTDRLGSCRLSCGLSPEQLRTRMAHIAVILEHNPHEQTTIDRGRRLIFPADPDLESQLRDLIRLESECCPFLEMTIERRGQVLILTVSGDDNAQEQIAQLFD